VTVRSMLASVLMVVAGSACAAGTYWALLNVPESSLPALLVSALLVVLTMLIVGYTIGLVLAFRFAPFRSSARLALRGFAGFLPGLVTFAVLFWLTTSIEDQWALHRGEIDAMFLRYIGTANTAWLHVAVSWLLWIVRWGAGLALVVSATAGSVTAGWRGGFRGLGDAFSIAPLAVMLAALLLAGVLWPLAYWRPRGLAGGSSELAFVVVKLGVLSVIGALLAVLVINAFARPDRTAASRSRASE
jgi:hypothetical protein